jgi:predicted ATPase
MDTVILKRALNQLVQAEITYRDDRSPDVTFHFKHALLQDVAYQSLLLSTRQQYHRSIARALVEKFPEIAAAQPELPAHHFSEGGQAREAIEYWQRAGARATQRSANAEAIAQYSRALGLLEFIDGEEQRARHEYQLLMGLIPPLISAKGYSAPEIEQTVGRALELAEKIGETSQVFPVLYGQYAYHIVTGNIRKAAVLGAEFARLYQAHPALKVAPIAPRLAAVTRFMMGDAASAQADIEAAIAAYDPAQHYNTAFTFGQDLFVAGLGYLCLVLWHNGLTDEARERHRQALA